jgi:hypothetical protein
VCLEEQDPEHKAHRYSLRFLYYRHSKRRDHFPRGSAAKGKWPGNKSGRSPEDAFAINEQGILHAPDRFNSRGEGNGHAAQDKRSRPGTTKGPVTPSRKPQKPPAGKQPPQSLPQPPRPKNEVDATKIIPFEEGEFSDF